MIFYFSATGNSRHVAERIAEILGDRTIPITNCLKNENFNFITQPGEKIGLVCPVYNLGLPITVIDFINNLNIKTNTDYVFTVVTYGGFSGGASKMLKDMLLKKGININAHYSVKMPDTWTPVYDVSNREKIDKLNTKADKTISKIIKRIQEEFAKTPDLIIKKIKLALLDTIYIVYLESVSSGDKVNDYILKNLSTLSTTKEKKNADLDSIIPGPNTKEIKNLDEIEFYLTNGFTIIIRNNRVLAIETKADINRGIPTPDTEPATNGPKDAFTENYQINLGLVKRRIKSNTLKTDEYIIGRKTKTKVGLLYFSEIFDATIPTMP